MFLMRSSPIRDLSVTPGLAGVTARSSSAAGFRWKFLATAGNRRSTVNLAADVYRRTPKMARLEAVLFVADEPLPIKRLVQLATLADSEEAQQLIDRLNLAYDTRGSTFRVERVATGLRLLTRREVVFWLDKLHQRKAASS